MMTIKTLLAGTLAGASLLTLTASAAFAQDPAGGGPGKKATRTQAGARRGPQGGAGLAQLDAGLRAANLTPDQLQEIKSLAIKFRDEVFAKLTPEQQEKVRAAMQGGAAGQAAGARPGGARAGRDPFGALVASLDLTEEQAAKIKPILADAQSKRADTMRDARASGKGAGREARQAIQNILSDLKTQIRPHLNAEQQARLDAYQPTRAAGKGKKARTGGAPPAGTGGAFGGG